MPWSWNVLPSPNKVETPNVNRQSWIYKLALMYYENTHKQWISAFRFQRVVCTSTMRHLENCQAGIGQRKWEKHNIWKIDSINGKIRLSRWFYMDSISGIKAGLRFYIIQYTLFFSLVLYLWALSLSLTGACQDCQGIGKLAFISFTYSLFMLIKWHVCFLIGNNSILYNGILC